MIHYLSLAEPQSNPCRPHDIRALRYTCDPSAIGTSALGQERDISRK
jgi:hypothetical protein